MAKLFCWLVVLHALSLMFIAIWFTLKEFSPRTKVDYTYSNMSVREEIPLRISLASSTISDFVHEANLSDSVVDFLSKSTSACFTANLSTVFIMSLTKAEQEKLANSTAAKEIKLYRAQLLRTFIQHKIPAEDLDIMKKVKCRVSNFPEFSGIGFKKSGISF